jgi:hypothetical protein
MKRLTTEEAKIYLTKEEDMLNSPLIGYTLTPDGKGWDEVTYYTSRKRKNEIKGEGKEWVYVLSNETMPGVLKIGYTKNHPEERAKQLSNSTGVAIPFKVEWAYKCHNGEQLEYETHQFLKEYRVNHKREFFTIGFEEAKEVIEKLGKRG